MHVFTIARVHGVAFGLPSPGCSRPRPSGPSSANIVDKTIRRLERKGIKADGHVLGTRNAAKKIVQEATEQDCEAIVMAADPDRNRVVGNVLWTQEPQRVRRRGEDARCSWSSRTKVAVRTRVGRGRAAARA